MKAHRKRYRPLRPEVLSRLTHELEVIEKLHLAPYFLLVWDIVEEARRRGNSGGGARVRGKFDSDLLPGHFLRVPAAMGIIFRAVFERAARQLPGH